MEHPFYFNHLKHINVEKLEQKKQEAIEAQGAAVETLNAAKEAATNADEATKTEADKAVVTAEKALDKANKAVEKADKAIKTAKDKAAKPPKETKPKAKVKLTSVKLKKQWGRNKPGEEVEVTAETKKVLTDKKIV